MRNLSSYRRKTRKVLRLPKAVTIFLLCGLLILTMCPAAQCNSSDNDDLLMYIPAMIAASAGWRNTTLSHPIPLTYESYDEKLMQCRIVQVEDGYWIAYTRYFYNYLFLLKTNLEGRTMIPPFQLTTVTRADGTHYYYRFALIPREDGGVQVLTTEKDEGSIPAILHDYVLDRQGKITRSISVMKERSLYSQNFKSLWAARTADGRTVFAAFSSGALWWGIYTDSGDAQSWEAVPDTSSVDYFAAHYDTALDRLYIMYSSYSPSNTTYMTRWAMDGTREIELDLSGQVGTMSNMYSYQLMPTPDGLFVSLPNYAGTYRFFLLNQDCTIKNQVEVNGLVVHVCSTSPASHMVTLDKRRVVRLAWRGATDHPRCYYAAFNLSGRLLVPAMNVRHEGSDNAMHPHVFVNGRRTTLFYSVANVSWRTLFCRHMAYDFQSGQPDLVVSVPHILQSPDYAILGAGIAFRVRVFNRGEAVSAATTVTLTHNGVNYIAPVGVLEPGESQLLETEFLDIPTPDFLTALPVVALDLANGYWSGNNHVEILVRYPGRTPVYPAGSGEYTWTVRIKDTTTPLQYAQVIATLPDMQTADGVVKDVVILYETDSAGEVTTRLPAGTYTFKVSRRGYPPETPSRTVPGPSSEYFYLEPPGTVTLTFEDNLDNSPLHPIPNRVNVVLEQGDYIYIAQGNEGGLVLNEVMRGGYTYSVKAFGYYEATGSLPYPVVGGMNNTYEISLTPTDRGSVSGNTTTNSGGSSLGDVYVGLEGTVIWDFSNPSNPDKGAFTLDDIPYGSYSIVCDKENYAPVSKEITVDSPTRNVGTFDLPNIEEADDGLGYWTESAWNRIDEIPSTFFNPNYKVTTSFGVFDFFGHIFYDKAGDAADFYSIYLDISGRKWYYYSVSTEFSLLDIAFSGLDNIVDGAGDLASMIVDEHADGFFDFLEAHPGGGGSGGSTIVRADSVCLYDGETDTVLYDSHDTWRQDYSFNGPMGYALGSAHTDNIHNVILRIYLKVMNQDFCIGPLYLMDKFRMEWRYDHDNFELKEIIQNPPDYPSFSAP